MDHLSIHFAPLSYPRVHEFSALFEALDRIVDGALEFYKENSGVFDLIEDAYISMRYMGRRYSNRSAEKAVELLKRFKEAFKRWVLSSQ